MRMNSGDEKERQRYWNGVQIARPKSDELKFIRREDPEHEDDDLAAARGLANGCMVSLMLWALILAGLWLATR